MWHISSAKVRARAMWDLRKSRSRISTPTPLPIAPRPCAPATRMIARERRGICANRAANSLCSHLLQSHCDEAHRRREGLRAGTEELAQIAQPYFTRLHFSAFGRRGVSVTRMIARGRRGICPNRAAESPLASHIPSGRAATRRIGGAKVRARAPWDLPKLRGWISTLALLPVVPHRGALAARKFARERFGICSNRVVGFLRL